MRKFEEGDIVVVNKLALLFQVTSIPDGEEGIISDTGEYSDTYLVRMKDDSGKSEDGFHSLEYELPEEALILKSEAEAQKRKIEKEKKFNIGDIVIIVPHTRNTALGLPEEKYFGKKGIVSEVKFRLGVEFCYSVRLEGDENMKRGVLEDGFRKHGRHFYEDALKLVEKGDS